MDCSHCRRRRKESHTSKKDQLETHFVVSYTLLNPSSDNGFELNFAHPTVPFLNPRVGGRQAIVAGIKKIAKHPVEIEVHKPGTPVNQERLVQQHFLEGDEPLLQLGQQFFLARAPAFDAAPSKLALFVPEEAQMIGGRHHFPPINVIELEAYAFDVVLD